MVRIFNSTFNSNIIFRRKIFEDRDNEAVLSSNQLYPKSNFVQTIAIRGTPVAPVRVWVKDRQHFPQLLRYSVCTYIFNNLRKPDMFVQCI